MKRKWHYKPQYRRMKTRRYFEFILGGPSTGDVPLSKENMMDVICDYITIIDDHTLKHCINRFWSTPSVRKEPTTQELGKSIERWPSMNHNATSCRRNLL
ncbi:hypothetical protein U9M48_027017 [Paspalum notatum var. saurae]|uniref:Uncharacterized protein n=1 Tax=Paspalum notatum var. saurae TaxID=547442 RepID=A0AAQ3TS23_PASNO